MPGRTAGQIGRGLLFALSPAIAGFVLAAYVPLRVDWASVSAAGMIATVSGLVLFAACLSGQRRKRAFIAT